MDQWSPQLHLTRKARHGNERFDSRRSHLFKEQQISNRRVRNGNGRMAKVCSFAIKRIDQNSLQHQEP